MISRIRSSVLSYLRQHHIALIALFVAMTGTAVAATALPARSVGSLQLRSNAVTSRHVAANTLTGADINEARLGTVPRATSATSATSATNATNATDATKLGGIAAASYARADQQSIYAFDTMSAKSTNTAGSTTSVQVRPNIWTVVAATVPATTYVGFSVSRPLTVMGVPQKVVSVTTCWREFSGGKVDTIRLFDTVDGGNSAAGIDNTDHTTDTATQGCYAVPYTGSSAIGHTVEVEAMLTFDTTFQEVDLVGAYVTLEPA